MKINQPTVFCHNISGKRNITNAIFPRYNRILFLFCLIIYTSRIDSIAVFSVHGNNIFIAI